MLPFSTSVWLSIVEFFSIILLHVVYAYNMYGIEKALLMSIGFLPVLLTLLLFRTIKSEDWIVRCFYVTMTITTYIVTGQLQLLGILIIIYFAEGMIIALYAKTRLLVEYIVVSHLVLILVLIFQTKEIEVFFHIGIYLIYLLIYCFGMITLLFLVTGVNSYKAKMEEKNEEARRAVEAKANFLANMSHEIRTPMNAISGMAQLLSEREFTKEENEYVATIQRSADSLLSIINEILDFSKIDSGNMEIIEEEYEFNSLIHDVLSIIEFRMKGKTIKLKVDVDPKVPRVLIGDELRLRQVLINLLNNAVNFTHRGYVTLHIHWVKNDEDSGVLEVAVEDTGIGISEENMNKLFRAFGQIDTRKNRNVEGTGLGLAISKSLLNLMGGDIWVRSKEKEGSTFSFRLPQRVKDSRPSNYETNHEEIQEMNDSFKITFRAPSAKIMIVDDNKVNLMVASELMKRFGFEATLVESGAEAVDRIEEHLVAYDVIFMDHMMPFMDGVEATQRIRALDTEYARELPIVALTANAIKGVEKQFRLAGMNDYISKPIHMKQLSEVLQKWIPIDKQIRVIEGKEVTPIKKEEKKTPGGLHVSQGLPKKDIIEFLQGINVEDGLRNCGGNRNVYVRVLQTFAASNLLAGLEEYFEQEDIQNYMVLSHSIKGACRNIGANDVADMAFELEKAGKRSDMPFIWDNHRDFADAYGKLLKKITKALLDYQNQ